MRPDVVLEGEHDLLRSENLQDNALLEVCQSLLPVSWQLGVFGVGAGCPFFPDFGVLLHVSNDAIEGGNLAAGRVEYLVIELIHETWQRVDRLRVLLLLGQRHGTSQQGVPASRRDDTCLPIDRCGDQVSEDQFVGFE